MLYEERVASLADLKRRLRVLDQDAGVRLVVGTGKKRSFMFVTRFGPKYTALTYSMLKSGAPGKKLQSAEFADFHGLEKYLGKPSGPLRAWVY